MPKRKTKPEENLTGFNKTFVDAIAKVRTARLAMEKYPGSNQKIIAIFTHEYSEGLAELNEIAPMLPPHQIGAFVNSVIDEMVAGEIVSAEWPVRLLRHAARRIECAIEAEAIADYASRTVH